MNRSRARVEVPMRWLPGAAILALGAFLRAATTLDAQGAGAVREARPITATPVEFPEPFSAVTRMIEPRAGQVIVWDQRDQRLSFVDLARGEQRTIAPRGQGPLEFRSVGALLRTPGDSVLLYDTGNRRMMLIAPDGRAVRTTPFGAAAGMFGMGRMSPRGVDAQGNWYGPALNMRSQREWIGTTYEETIVRSRPLAERMDTISAVRVPKLSDSRFSQGVLTFKSHGIVTGDAWGVFPDGRLIVVRTDTYTPELIGRDGRRVVAPPLPFTPVPISERDRQAHLDSIGAMVRGAQVRARGGGPVDFTANVTGPAEWQEFHPPLLSTEIHVDSRGRAWVHVRDRDRASGERYDLLDSRGRLIDPIRLPKGTKFAAMGSNAWYGTREDADGLVYLQRFPLP